jgi:hypothetical protein
MLKHFYALLSLLLLASGTNVFAQTSSETPAPGSSGAEMGGGLNWLWILIAVIVVAAIIWYFTKRRSTTI